MSSEKEPVPKGVGTSPKHDEKLCREVREMLGDTPEEAECGCREEPKD